MPRQKTIGEERRYTRKRKKLLRRGERTGSESNSRREGEGKMRSRVEGR